MRKPLCAIALAIPGCRLDTGACRFGLTTREAGAKGGRGQRMAVQTATPAEQRMGVSNSLVAKGAWTCDLNGRGSVLSANAVWRMRHARS
jgi:hypothetical protein